MKTRNLGAQGRSGPAHGPGGLAHLSPHCSIPHSGHWREGGDLAGPWPEAMRGGSSALPGGEKRPLKLEWKKRIVMAHHHSTLQEFKEVGEAGRGQVIVTDAGLTLEGAGDWDPLLTQLYQLGVGWTQAIVNMSGKQSHLCALLLAAKTGSEEGGAGEKCRGWLPVPGAQPTSLGSA